MKNLCFSSFNSYYLVLSFSLTQVKSTFMMENINALWYHV